MIKRGATADWLGRHSTKCDLRRARRSVSSGMAFPCLRSMEELFYLSTNPAPIGKSSEAIALQAETFAMVSRNVIRLGRGSHMYCSKSNGNGAARCAYAT